MVIKSLGKSMINLVGDYGKLIEEHLRVLDELEKCRQLRDEQTSEKIKEIK